MKKAKKIKKQLSLYYLENDKVYIRSLSMPLLMCLDNKKVTYVLRELHDGIHRSHVVGASLVGTLRVDCMILGSLLT